MIYLGSPYSHPEPAVREMRFDAACKAAAVLMQRGHLVFSPVCYSHQIAKHGLPTDWVFWEKYDRAILRRCEEVWVLMLPGWESSRGVQAEIKIAREMGMPVEFIDPCNVITKTTPANAGAVEDDFTGQKTKRIRKAQEVSL